MPQSNLYIVLVIYLFLFLHDIIAYPLCRTLISLSLVLLACEASLVWLCPGGDDFATLILVLLSWCGIPQSYMIALVQNPSYLAHPLILVWSLILAVILA